MGSGAYGVVMSVRVPVSPHSFIVSSQGVFFYFFLVGFLISIPDIVSSAADEISGETVAIKMVTRIFAKTTLAKRALREITLLRHFSNHENITGLIDVDGITESFNEMCELNCVDCPERSFLIYRHCRYLFMEVRCLQSTRRSTCM